MNITIIGIGYVGLANGVLLAQNHRVTLVDIVKEKINQINSKISPIKDTYISSYLKSVILNIKATQNPKEAYEKADLIIIATPTNYDPNTNFFDTNSIEESLNQIFIYNKNVPIIIKSTVPVGYTKSLQKKYNYQNIIFSPEFLREGQALYDSLYPSRIIIANKKSIGKKIAKIFLKACLKDNVEILYTDPTEAEAIKLFSNTYLAMRVTFFNELDSFAIKNNLKTDEIIKGVCLDPRIGNHYNNPSFGYGGYCLPKDTKQLLANYKNIPNNIIKAIVDSNETRKDFIAKEILDTKSRVIGVYRLIMKHNSDNYRESAIFGVINALSKKNKKIIIYEPNLKEKNLSNFEVIKSFKKFVKNSDLIIANRLEPKLKKFRNKVFTRDITNEN